MLGPLLALPRPQVTTLAIESGFQNGTVGIVGAMLSQPGSAAVLTDESPFGGLWGSDADHRGSICDLARSLEEKFRTHVISGTSRLFSSRCIHW